MTFPQKLLTIFTPTYNRSELLNRCYRSLINQTNKNFLWQIIDDGSTDDTRSVVKSFIEEDLISIKYYYKQNGGKVSAINMSLDLVETQLWVCLDSDDYFLENAVSTICELYPNISEDPSVYGLFSLRCDSQGSPMQKINLPKGLTYSTQYDIRFKYKIPPEYCQVYKSEIVKKYKYPIFNNEKYVPLSYVPDQLDQCYKLFLTDICFMVCEYQSDGITKNNKKLIVKNPYGYTAFKRQQIVYAKTLSFKIKACVCFGAGNILCGRKSPLYDSPSKFISIITLPLSYIYFAIVFKSLKKA